MVTYMNDITYIKNNITTFSIITTLYSPYFFDTYEIWQKLRTDSINKEKKIYTLEI